MTENKKSIWQIILDFIINLLTSTTETKNDKPIKDDDETEEIHKKDVTDSIKKSDIFDDMTEVAKDEIKKEGTKLLIKHGEYLAGLTDAQREYAIEIAYLKSVNDLSTLSFKELKEYRKHASKALELGIEVSEEMNSFWNDFLESIKSLLKVVGEIGAKSLATALKVIIL